MILIAFEFVTRLLLAFRVEACLFSRPAIDDAFYALICSYHLALGHGLTADGVHLTNGVQPLIVFLHVPLFWLAHDDKLMALRYVYVLSAIFAALRTYVFASILVSMDRSKISTTPWWRSAPVIGAFLSVVLYNLYLQDTNGLETGLYVLIVLVVLRFYQSLHKRAHTRLSDWIQLGVLCGVMVLTRIDAIFFVAALAAARLFKRDNKSVRDPFAFIACAALISSPWWLYNFLTFGSLMPISGKAQIMGASLSVNLTQGAYQLGDLLSTFFYLPRKEYPDLFITCWCGLVLASLMIVFRIFRLREAFRRYDLKPLLPFAIASIGIILYYLVTFKAFWFFNRYWEPVRALWTIPVALALTSISETFAQKWKQKSRALAIIAIAGFVLMIGFNLERIASTYWPSTIAWQYPVAQWAISHPNETIGMEQSGIAGYFANNVVNLDGKVNREALLAREQHRMGEYIQRSNITYLIDWDMLLDPILKDATRVGVSFSREPSIGSMSVYHRISN